jgi:small subunit ribosomal protein S4
MKRKHKTYSKPKRPFDKARIDEEAEIKKEFGLKNKKELWKADAKVKSMREKAKQLIKAKPEEQQALFDRLKKIGIEVNSVADVLSLDKNDYLARRLQTVLVKKKLATTSKTARQMIVHKKVLVDGEVVNTPSYVVSTALENKITLKPQKEKPKKVEEAPQEAEEKVEEVKEETGETKDE